MVQVTVSAVEELGVLPVLYLAGFLQALWLERPGLAPTHPHTKEAVENGWMEESPTSMLGLQSIDRSSHFMSSLFAFFQRVCSGAARP